MSTIFILSCNQNSEEQADHKETKEVTKEEVTNTNSDCPRCIWAIKKEPDGTITKVMWEAADGSYIRPDGFEWKKVQGESPRKYLREPSTFEGILEEGVTPPDGPDQGKPAIFKFANPYDEGDTTNIDAELIDIHRADALRDLQEYLYDTELESRCDGTPYHPKEEECTGEAATKITASGTLYSKKVGGIEVTIEIDSTTIGYEGTPKSGSYQPYEFVDEVMLVISIYDEAWVHDNEAVLSLLSNMKQAKPSTKPYIFSQQMSTYISADPPLATTHDFFLKLSELGLISERWNLDNPAFPLGYSLYFVIE